MGLGVALRAFTGALFNKQTAERVRTALDSKGDDTNIGKPPRISEKKPADAAAAKPTSPNLQTSLRSDAITLLSTLQREARLIDLIQEDLAKYSDAQVGAAARPCLTQCSTTLSRLFGLAPVRDVPEGTTIEISEEQSPETIQWIGEGTSTSGKLIHHGWMATKVELPKWNGDATNARIIAPAQVSR